MNFRQLKGFATDAFSGIAANAVAAGAKADIAKYVSMTVGAGVSRSNVTANAGLGVSLW